MREYVPGDRSEHRLARHDPAPPPRGTRSGRTLADVVILVDTAWDGDDADITWWTSRCVARPRRHGPTWTRATGSGSSPTATGAGGWRRGTAERHDYRIAEAMLAEDPGVDPGSDGFSRLPGRPCRRAR